MRIRREILGDKYAGYGEQIVYALSAQLRPTVPDTVEQQFADSRVFR
jgi:hypothetical protein